MDDRQQDNWRPLLSIAAMAGKRWNERCRQAALRLSVNNAESDNNPKVRLVTKLKDIFAESARDRMSSTEIIGKLKEREESYTEKLLAATLKTFHVKPAGTIRLGKKTAKGYYLKDLQDCFSRYASYTGASQPSQPSQPSGARRQNGKKVVTLRQKSPVTAPSQNKGNGKVHQKKEGSYELDPLEVAAAESIPLVRWEQ